MTGADLHPNAIDGTTGTELTAPSLTTLDGRWLKKTGGTITPTANGTATLQVFKQDGTTKHMVISLARFAGRFWRYNWKTLLDKTCRTSEHMLSVLDIDTTNARVGITTSAPGYTLSLGQGLANTKLALYDDGGGQPYGLGVQGNQLRIHLGSSTGRFSFLDATGGSELFTVKGTGNVGVGTSSPDASLKVVGLTAISSGFDGVGDNYTSRGVSGGSLTMGWDATNNYGNITSITEGVAWRRLHYRAMEHVFQVGSGPIPGAMLLSSSGNLGIGLGINGANSRLQVAGAIATAFSAKNAAYTLAISDSTVTADGTSAAFQITLPTAAGVTGRQYTIKRINAGANNVTVGTILSQTVDGATAKTLGAQWSAITVQSDGANWVIVNQMGTVS